MSRRAWVLFSVLGVVWGAPYLLIRVAVSEVDPWVVAFGRTLIGTLLLLPLVSRRSISAAVRVWPWLLAFSVLEIVGPWVLLGHAETHLPSSTTGLLVAVTPLVATVVVASIGLERLDRLRTAGLVVGLAGVVGLVGLDVEVGDAPAVLAVVLSATGYALGPVIVQRKLSDVPPVTVIACALAVATLAYTPAAAGRWPATWSVEAAWSVALLGVVCTAVAFVLFFTLIAEAGAARATVITYVNPAVAIVLGAAILDEPFTTGMLLGFPLIVVGSALATRRVPPRRVLDDPGLGSSVRGELHDPVRLPRAAPVGGYGLLPPRRVQAPAIPAESQQVWLPSRRPLLRVEQTHVPVEAALHGNPQAVAGVSGVQPPDRPLP